ncbi:MAG TPA: glycosyltransferase family 39 protein [Myxococcota bacterium]|nr:glycosyltransferase family 39 protein [Myxococcota bacterium]
MDPWAWAGLSLALVASAFAAWSARRGALHPAVSALALAALCLRVPPAAHFGLSPWDERYHALVAKNALDDFWVPKLVAEPLAEPAPDDWKHSHVWLHKPPGMTWLIAGSYALFGVNEGALRLPSVLLSSGFVLLVFAIARRFATPQAALLAAALAAWHARLLLLVAGERATDHVDVGMTCATALGVLCALRAAESANDSPRRFAARVALVGVTTALAWYVKETPALIVPALLAAALRARSAGWRTTFASTGGALAVAALLVLPWLLYTAHAFPELAAFARGRGARYFLHVVDGQGGPWWFHLANLPLDFGWAAPLALGWLALESLRRRELRPLAAWAALVYGVFSLAATKMQSYVLIAAPAVLAAVGWLVLDALPRRLRPVALVLVAANALWSVTGVEEPWQQKARDPLWAAELRRLGSALEQELPAQKRLLFVPDSPLECMFYVRATCLAERATPERVTAARAAGFAVASYGDPALPGVTHIPFDPAAEPARRLARALKAAKSPEVLVFHAREPEDLGAYLRRTLKHAEASADWPRASRKLARKLEHGALLVVLLPPGAPAPPQLHGDFPDALFLEDARYARPLD